MQFTKAKKQKLKIKIGISGTSGSGKTYSALRLATGMGKKIAMIDTERGSGKLYADKFNYDICEINPPYTPERFTDAIKSAESAGYDVIIIDSISHAWFGEGGILSIHENIAKKERNSFAAWAKVTPRQNKLVDTITGVNAHTIACFRSKQAYEITENEKGKKVPQKMGLAPIQREGFDYEFSVFFELISCMATAGKDRTSLFSQVEPFQITEETGKIIADWSDDGSTAELQNSQLSDNRDDNQASQQTDKIAYATPAQISHIETLKKQLNTNDAVFTKRLKDKFNADSPAQISKTDAKSIIASMEKKLAKISQESDKTIMALFSARRFSDAGIKDMLASNYSVYNVSSLNNTQRKELIGLLETDEDMEEQNNESQ